MPSGHRHERKYVLPAELAGDAEARLRLRPGGCAEVYPPRQVNSLYYDGVLGERYWENVEGLGWRDKVRIRWYGDFWGRIESPVLEVKVKAGHAGAKRRWPLPAFELAPATRGRVVDALPATAREAGLFELRQLAAVLVTRYRRRYYATRDRRVRLTLDRDVRYRRPPGRRGFTASWRRDPEAVVELKYAVGDEARAHDLAQALGLRMSRNSKYAKGIAATVY